MQAIKPASSAFHELVSRRANTTSFETNLSKKNLQYNYAIRKFRAPQPFASYVDEDIHSKISIMSYDVAHNS